MRAFLVAWWRGAPPTPRRLGVLVAFCALYPLHQAFVWGCWGFDGLIERLSGRRDPDVRGAVFIVGNFRSGTTFLHRLLAQHPGLSTCALWEILFAPSRTGKSLLRPVFELLGRGRSVGGTIHRTGWLEPEEDDYVHLNQFAALTVGMASGLPDLARAYLRFDEEVPDRKRLVDYYVQCASKHLAHARPGARYLGKNPALTPKLATVAAALPDAKFLVIERDLEETRKSLRRMMQVTWQAVGALAEDASREEFLGELVTQFHAYPRRLAEGALAGRIHFIDFRELVSNPVGVVRGVCEFCEIEADPALIAAAEAERSTPV